MNWIIVVVATVWNNFVHSIVALSSQQSWKAEGNVVQSIKLITEKEKARNLFQNLAAKREHLWINNEQIQRGKFLCFSIHLDEPRGTSLHHFSWSFLFFVHFPARALHFSSKLLVSKRKLEWRREKSFYVLWSLMCDGLKEVPLVEQIRVLCRRGKVLRWLGSFSSFEETSNWSTAFELLKYLKLILNVN